MHEELRDSNVSNESLATQTTEELEETRISNTIRVRAPGDEVRGTDRRFNLTTCSFMEIHNTDKHVVPQNKQ